MEPVAFDKKKIGRGCRDLVGLGPKHRQPRRMLHCVIPNSSQGKTMGSYCWHSETWRRATGYAVPLYVVTIVLFGLIPLALQMLFGKDQVFGLLWNNFLKRASRKWYNCLLFYKSETINSGSAILLMACVLTLVDYCHVSKISLDKGFFVLAGGWAWECCILFTAECRICLYQYWVQYHSLV